MRQKRQEIEELVNGRFRNQSHNAFREKNQLRYSFNCNCYTETGKRRLNIVSQQFKNVTEPEIEPETFPLPIRRSTSFSMIITVEEIS